MMRGSIVVPSATDAVGSLRAGALDAALAKLLLYPPRSPLPMPDEPTPDPTPQHVSKDPLHGITLKTILTQLVDLLGWEELGRRIDIRCFNESPSVSSSLKFLRKTPWARSKVEKLYLRFDFPK
jgi:hypothetical protein